MTNQRVGKHSFQLKSPPTIKAWASVAGKKEALGPLGTTFDVTCKDSYYGQKTWEQAEKRMQQLYNPPFFLPELQMQKASVHLHSIPCDIFLGSP